MNYEVIGNRATIAVLIFEEQLMLGRDFTTETWRLPLELTTCNSNQLFPHPSSLIKAPLAFLSLLAPDYLDRYNNPLSRK
jgi:hypothetical protein